jgi:branched-chain amino acid transport system permease protein
MAAGAAFVEAMLAAAIAAVLGLPILGLRLNYGGGGNLYLEPRLGLLAIAAAVVFALRLTVALARGRWRPRLPKVLRLNAAASARGRFWFGLLLIAATALLPILPLADRYRLNLAISVLIYAMLGWGLNIVVGLAGLLDLGYAAFYAVGAYSFALLARDAGLGFWGALPLAGGLAAAFGLLLGFPVLRMRGDYLAVVTLGFGEIVRIILNNWSSLTGGPDGMGEIPRPTLFGWSPSASGGAHSLPPRMILLFYIVLALALATNGVALRLRRLPLGRAWEAMRQDEEACRALGLNPTNLKLSAFAMGALFGGLAGCFFATRQGFISPDSFTFTESATVLSIVVLGGAGSQIGVALAAALLVLLPELGRDLAHYRMLVFGLAMLLVVLWRPQGLVGRRRATIRLGYGEREG